MEEVVAPHRDFGVERSVSRASAVRPEPVGRRNPGVIYGLGNLVENAVDFARGRVGFQWPLGMTPRCTVSDPRRRPGLLRRNMIERMGEPYLADPQARSGGNRRRPRDLGCSSPRPCWSARGAAVEIRQFVELRHGAGARSSPVRLAARGKSIFRPPIGGRREAANRRLRGEIGAAPLTKGWC